MFIFVVMLCIPGQVNAFGHFVSPECKKGYQEPLTILSQFYSSIHFSTGDITLITLLV